jgi:hypothetical protein
VDAAAQLGDCEIFCHRIVGVIPNHDGFLSLPLRGYASAVR